MDNNKKSFIEQTAIDYDMPISDVEWIYDNFYESFYEKLEEYLTERAQ